MLALAAAPSVAAEASSPAQQGSAAYISRLVTQLPRGVTIDPAEWSRSTYVDRASPSDAAWSLRINNSLLRPTLDDAASLDASDAADANGLARSLLAVQRAARAEAVLRRSKDGPWQLLKAGPNGAVTVLGSADAEAPAGAATRAILGYDAVVVSQDGRTVLAQAPALDGRLGIYAVALADSAGRLTYAADEAVKKTALLQLTSVSKQLCTFKIISQTELDSPLAYGTKLRLEKPR